MNEKQYQLKKNRNTTSYVTGFINIISEIKTKLSNHDGLVCFRGESQDHGYIEPKVFRNEFYEVDDSECRMLSELFEAAPEEFSSDDCMLDKLVRAQHYGLPTRLLDVTLNPLVALYFACSDNIPKKENAKDGRNGIVSCIPVGTSCIKRSSSDTVSLLCNMAQLTSNEQQEFLNSLRSEYQRHKEKTMDECIKNSLPDDLLQIKASELNERPLSHFFSDFSDSKTGKKLLHFIKKEKSYFEPEFNILDFAKLFFIYPKMNNRRIIAQSGAFLVRAFRTDGHDTMYVPENTISIIIDKNCKKIILDELNNLSINQGALFPEISEKAKYITKKYREMPNTLDY